jgi:hypothetical protein
MLLLKLQPPKVSFSQVFQIQFCIGIFSYIPMRAKQPDQLIRQSGPSFHIFLHTSFIFGGAQSLHPQDHDKGSGLHPNV